MDEKIKVLIVDDNEGTRDGTRQLLAYEDNIDIIGFAENGRIAIERVQELQPHVVLMDINMPEMTGIEATEQLREVAPRTKVIMVSVQDDTQYLKQAFKAGAVDFVAKPVTSAELVAAIERAYMSIGPEPVAAPQPPPGAGQMPMAGGPPSALYPQMPVTEGFIITVVGFKGGVGKTTVAVNLAIGLAQAGKRTVLVDSNVQFGDVSVFLNTRGASGSYNVTHLGRVAADPSQLDPNDVESVLLPHESGLKLLIAPANPHEADEMTGDGLANLLVFLKQRYDYVVVDTAVTLDAVLDGAFQVADRVIAVVTATMPALKDAKILMTLMSDAAAMEKMIVVLNQVDRYSSISADQIGNFLRRPVAVQIPTDPTAIEAVNKGIPLITLDAKRAPGVRPLMEMVQVVRSGLEVVEGAPQQEQPQRRGLFG